MNTRKLRKMILTLCSALLLVSMSVGITVAYLTSTTEAVVNTFKVGSVNITLDEAAVKPESDAAGNPTGNIVADATKDRVRSNNYQLYPNSTYAKDPTIHVLKGSEECWVVAKVVVTAKDDEGNSTIANLRKQIGYEGDYLGFHNIVSGGVFGSTYNEDPTGTWTSTDGNYVLTQEVNTDNNTFYVYFQKAQNAKDAQIDLPLFTTIHIPSEWGNDELANLAGLKMDITAYAVQKEGFNDVETAFTTAFPGV